MHKIVKTNCQSCGAEVEVIANNPYFGILCSKCFGKNKGYTITEDGSNDS